MVDDNDFYTNLLKATDNLQDITFTRYATVTKLLGNGKCDVKESDNELIHNDVPILNGLSLLTGDTVVLGFAQNSLYNPFIVGVLNRELGSGGGDGSEFCQALVDAYTSYTLTNTTPDCQTIIATLKGNNSPLPNEELKLYDDTLLMSTETTDTNGQATFTLTDCDKEYTVKYRDKATSPVTPYWGINYKCISIDGTSTILEKIEEWDKEIVWYDNCNSSTMLSKYDGDAVPYMTITEDGFKYQSYYGKTVTIPSVLCNANDYELKATIKCTYCSFSFDRYSINGREYFKVDNDNKVLTRSYTDDSVVHTYETDYLWNEDFHTIKLRKIDDYFYFYVENNGEDDFICSMKARMPNVYGNPVLRDHRLSLYFNNITIRHLSIRLLNYNP